MFPDRQLLEIIFNLEGRCPRVIHRRTPDKNLSEGLVREFLSTA